MNPRLASLVLSLLAASLAGCAKRQSCPVDRLPDENGVCVRPDVLDFVSCVRSAAGSSAIDNETARSITVAATQASVTGEWKDSVRTRYAGPSGDNQTLVINQCMARTQPKAPALDEGALVGSWELVLPDGIRKRLEVSQGGSFTASESGQGAQCSYLGVLRLQEGRLYRTITRADCTWAPVGVTDEFQVLSVTPGQFVLKTPGGEVTYVRAQLKPRALGSRTGSARRDALSAALSSGFVLAPSPSLQPCLVTAGLLAQALSSSRFTARPGLRSGLGA